MKNSILLPLKQLRIVKGWVSPLVEMEELPDPGGPRGRSGGFGQAGSGSHHCRISPGCSCGQWVFSGLCASPDFS